MRQVDVSPNPLRELFSLYEPNFDLIVSKKICQREVFSLCEPSFDLVVLEKTCYRMSNKNKGVCCSVVIQESY